MVYILKVFLKKQDEGKQDIHQMFMNKAYEEKYEIRRTTINSSVTNDYNLLCDKIMTVFPVLTGKCFNLEWIDSDNDRITMSGNNELAHAIASADGELLKIYVNYELPKGPENGICPNMQHIQVVCDSCNSEIRGFRYKCLQCPDFDLCHLCSTAGKHSDHDMLKMARPASVTRDWVFPGWRKLWNSLFAYNTVPRKCFEGKKHRRHPNFSNFGFYKKMDPVLRDLINFEYFGGAVGAESNSDSEEAATCPKQCKTKNKQGEPSKEDINVPKDAQKSDDTKETTKPKTPEPEQKTVIDAPITKLYPDLNSAACGARPKTSTLSENSETSVKMTRSATRDKTPDGTGEAETCAYPDGWTVLNAVKDDFLRESSKFVPFPKFLSEGVFARAHAYANGEGMQEHPSGPAPTTNQVEKEQVSVPAPINSEGAKEQASVSAPTNGEVAKEQVSSPAPVVDEPKKETSPYDATIANALMRMQAMGFTNEGGWLQRLLETKNGNINETLDALYPNNGRR